MELQRSRGGVWARFFAAEQGTAIDVPEGGRLDRYRVDAVDRRLGAPVRLLERGMSLVRLEAPAPVPVPVQARGWAADGVVQHLQYTDADKRRELAAISAGEHGGRAVIIPIAKSDAWWALAHDERARFFRRAPDRPGHIAIGSRYAPTIFRRLYQARYQPGSEWDFITYFELADDDLPGFRQMLAELRDPGLNPEWSFVERETEIWLTKE
jgi:hypothetical protein